MDNNPAIVNIIRSQGLVPLFFHSDRDLSLMIVKALYQAGIRLIEWTHRGENALETFKYLKNHAAATMPGLHLGAGTVKNKTLAADYINAEADFIISPAMIPEVGEVANANRTVWIPGCMTPTEIAQAETAGALMVKIFPSNIVGPGFVRAVKEVFPEMLFMPTGGIEKNAQHLQAWFDAGVVAVGMGSSLISKNIIAEKNFARLTSDTKEMLDHIKDIKRNE